METFERNPFTQHWGECRFSVERLPLWQWRTQAEAQAIAANIPSGEVDWLLSLMSDLSRLELRLGMTHDRPVQLRLPWTDLQTLWQQRIEARKPLQHLLGFAPWRDFWLRVSPDVLIPRPETELIIDLAQQAVIGAGLDPTDSQWADLGTGSGAIALGLATTFPTATIHAIDYSEAALAIAQANATAYQLKNRIRFYQGSWLEPLTPLKGQLQGIVSNPPYIPTAIVPTLQPEVTQHEPHLALDGGTDGLASVQHLIAIAPLYLQPSGIWLVELMAGQAPTVANLLAANGNYQTIQIHADLAGIERFVSATRKESGITEMKDSLSTANAGLMPPQHPAS